MQNSRPIVLTLLAHYLPGYKAGGPVQTIANMVDQLGDDFDFRIVTADRDISDKKPYTDVRIDGWNVVGKAKVFYASTAFRTFRGVARLINDTPHDALYLNSYFNSIFTLRPLLARHYGLITGRPTVLAPRGEFSEGALALKRWKKILYRKVSHAVNLYRRITWQASSGREAESIRVKMGITASRILIAPNFPPLRSVLLNGQRDRKRVRGEPLRVCFLSRIAPMKNLDFALRVLSKVRTAIVFDIYGPIEDLAYWSKSVALLDHIHDPVRVRYRGAVEHIRVAPVLRDYDLFFLPTLGENFGHVILESMMVGTPVLIANTTPWRNLEDLGVGWDLPLTDTDAFVAAILKVANMDAAEYLRWRDRVREYALQRCNNADVLEANRQLFLRAIEDSWD